MKPNFSIGIPTLNRFDLLHPALEYYHHDFPETRIYIVDNGQQIAYSGGIRTARVPMLFYTPKTNMGVAASWNWLINEIFENIDNEYAVILNDDIYWGMDQDSVILSIENFKRECGIPSNKNGFILAPAESKYDWCMFIINRKAWHNIGKFDKTFFPAYFEDCDYKYRAKLAGVPVHKVLAGPARFVTSGSAQKDKTLLSAAAKNRDYYISKWGGEPGNEIFTEPFDGKNNPPEK